MIILLRVPMGSEPEVELLHEQADDHAHLLHREVLPDAVRGAERERDERVQVVHERLDAHVLAFARGDEPSVGEEGRGRRAEVARVAVY